MLNSCYSAALTLALTVDKNGDVNGFDYVAAQIADQNPIIDVLQLVPDGIIQYTYPMEGNEAVIGYDILKNQFTALEAKEAIARKELFFAGPFELKQGGVGVVARLPVFISDEFWGFSAVIIKIDKLIAIMNMDEAEEEGYTFRFYKKNPYTNEVEYFIDNTTVGRFYYEQTYYFEQGDWYLQIGKSPSAMHFISLLLLLKIGLAFSIVSYFFVRNILKKPQELQNLVDKQALSLILREQKIKAILDALPDLLFVVDREGTFLDFHASVHQPTLLQSGDFLHKTISDVLGEELGKESMKHIAKVLQNNLLSIHHYSLQYPDGVRYFEGRYVKMSEGKVLLIVRDITISKMQVDKIEMQNEKLREIAWLQSHTVRAPLARIMGLVSLILDLDKDLQNEKDEYLRHLIEAANSLDQIIRSIVNKAEQVSMTN